MKRGRKIQPETIEANKAIGVPEHLADKPDWYIAQFMGGLLASQVARARRLQRGLR